MPCLLDRRLHHSPQNRERGGSGADKMISYEAAPGAKVYIKGSEVAKDGWTQDPINTFRRPGGPNANPAAPPPPQVPIWGYRFTGAMFPDAYNPFALASVAGIGEDALDEGE